MDAINRLQFVHSDYLFKTAEDVKTYVNMIIEEHTQGYEPYYAEPMVFKYGESDTDAHIILAIGSRQKTTLQASDLPCVHFIDTASIEEDLEKAIEDIAKDNEALEALTVFVNNINTSCGLEADGTYDIDKHDDIIGTSNSLKEAVVLLSNYLQNVSKNLITEGKYSPVTQEIILTKENGEEIKFSAKPLIDEWIVDVNSSSPIQLYRHKVENFDSVSGEWQDILSGDVRIASAISFNILHKNDEGTALFADGRAVAITCLDTEGNETNVQEELRSINKKLLIPSSNDNNLITKKLDGVYAYADLTYNSNSNEITFTKTTNDGSLESVTYKLNSIKFIDKAVYNPDTETIVITYTTASGSVETYQIPVSSLFNNIQPKNGTTNVDVFYERNTDGRDDFISANAKISEASNNILEEVGHALYVNGVASNIKFDETHTVEDKLVADDASIASINNEIEDLKSKDENLDARLTTDETNIAENKANIAINKENLNLEIERAKDAEKDLNTAVNSAKAVADEAKANSVTNATNIETNKDNIAALSADFEVWKKDVEENVENIIKNSSAITEVKDALKAEETRATSAETALGTSIDKVAHDLSDEITRAKAEESDITIKFDEAVALLQDADKEITSDLEKEETRATEAEATLTKEINSIDSKLTSEINRAETSETQLKTDLGTAITNETNRAETAEATLKSDLEKEITDETNRAQTAEATLKSDLETTIANEVNRATNAETSVRNDLKTDITSEINRATSAETAIRSELTADYVNETNRAMSAETAIKDELNATISANKADADSKIDVLTTKVNDNYDYLVQSDANITKSLTEEVARAKAEENKLSEAVEKNETSINSVSAVTHDALADLTNLTNEVSAISGDVKNISSNVGAINNATLTYDAASNKITFKDNSGVTTTYQINSVYIIDAITYDSDRDVINITWVDKDGLQKTTEVDVVDFFKGIRGENSDTVNVTVTKDADTKQDVIKAEVNASNLVNDSDTVKLSVSGNKITASVVVSSDDDNAIQATNSGLYVENNAKAIKASYGDNIITVQEAINKLKSTEEENAKNAETALNNEIARAEAIEAGLRTDLDKTTADLANEITRATSEESSIKSDLADEIATARKEEAQNASNISNEISRATSAETNITTALTYEVSRATSREDKLDERVTSAETGITANTASIDKLKEEIDALKFSTSGDTKDINSKIDALQASLDKVWAMLETLYNKSTIVNADGSDVTLTSTYEGGNFATLKDSTTASSANTKIKGDLTADLND